MGAADALPAAAAVPRAARLPLAPRRQGALHTRARGRDATRPRRARARARPAGARAKDPPRARPPRPALVRALARARRARSGLSLSSRAPLRRSAARAQWHLGHYNDASLPTSRGFESFFGMLDGAQYYATHVDTMQCKLPGKLMYRGAEDYATVAPDVTGHGCYFDLRDGVEPAPGYWGQYTTTSSATARSTSSAATARRPCSLTLAFNAVHAPVWAPDDAYERYPELHNVTNGLRRRFSAALRLVDESVDALVQRAARQEDVPRQRARRRLGQRREPRARRLELAAARLEGLPVRGRRARARLHPRAALRARGRAYDGIFHISDWLPTLVEGFVGGNVAALGSTAKQLAAGDAALNGTWFGRAPAAAVAQLRQTAPCGRAQPQQRRASLAGARGAAAAPRARRRGRRSGRRRGGRRRRGGARAADAPPTGGPPAKALPKDGPPPSRRS